MSRVPLRAALGALLLAASPVCAQTTVSHSWDGTELVSAYRLTRDGVQSNWQQPPKAFPGLEFGTEYLVKTFDFVNPYAMAAGFLVTGLGSTWQPFGNTHLVAYLGGINLLDLSDGYLGDAGVSCVAMVGCSPEADFSVLVPAGATVQVAAFRLQGGVVQGGTFEFTSGWVSPATVVPEPRTYALIATGLAALVAVRRRRAV